MDKIKILVCCHKPGNYYQDDCFLPIQAGKAIADVDLGIQGDDTGDNISEKNKQYCETTALYWAWKNLKNVEYIGLNHYRRRFKESITSENIDKLMKGKDVMLVKPAIFPHSPIQLLHNLTCLEDVTLFLDTILTLYPEYEESVIEYYQINNRFFPFQMFVMRRKEFEKYAEFLFSILFKVEERILPSCYSRLNRSLAYMGEFLLGLYCIHNKFNIKYMEYEGTGTENHSKLTRILRHTKSDIIFSLLRHKHEVPIPWGGVDGLKQDNITLYSIKER